MLIQTIKKKVQHGPRVAHCLHLVIMFPIIEHGKKKKVPRTLSSLSKKNMFWRVKHGPRAAHCLHLVICAMSTPILFSFAINHSKDFLFFHSHHTQFLTI